MTTEMGKRAKLIESGADTSLANATAQPQMSLDKMTDMYMQMRYEERQQMLLHLIGEQGMKGLDASKRILKHAYVKYGNGAEQPGVGQ